MFSKIFKAYDVRGIYSSEINETIVYRIGEAYAAVVQPKKVAVGQDVRSSGKSLKKELISALLKSGVDVVDVGIITTDQLYFAVGKYDLDGGISVTASHNPGEYNGLKFAEKNGAPITSETLLAICKWAESNKKFSVAAQGSVTGKNILLDYTQNIFSIAKLSASKKINLVVNANFGAVGRGVDILADKLNLKLERLNWEEDGNFPKGPPNPLLPENRDETIALIKKTRPDFGVAWDADADRVFFFTGSGEFIPSCYIIALLAPEFLKKYPGAPIVHDLTTAWVIDDAVKASGGQPVASRTGHTFVKALMRKVNAPFAGESSGHYYFKDTFYADNGIIPLLMILEMISKTGKTLEELVKPLMGRYKVSGEINFLVKDAKASIELLEAKYGKLGKVDHTDGLVVESASWRLSARPSNTEPLFRLNAESRSQKTLDCLIKEVTDLIKS